MKKLERKIISLILTIVMIVGVCVTATGMITSAVGTKETIQWGKLAAMQITRNTKPNKKTLILTPIISPKAQK